MQDRNHQYSFALLRKKLVSIEVQAWRRASTGPVLPRSTPRSPPTVSNKALILILDGVCVNEEGE
jgi:hypothetical protein